MPLPRAGFFHHRSVRRAARDERGSGGGGPRRRQAVPAVGVGGDPAQDIRNGYGSSQQVVDGAFLRGHRPRVPARGEHAPCRIPGVGGDGFRRDDGFPVHHGGTRDFHQLARRVVGVVRPDAVFIDFPQQASVAHQFAFREPAVSRRPLHPPVLRVKFVDGAARERPLPGGKQEVVFFPDALPFRRDPGDGARALSRHGFSVDARFHRFRVEGAVLRRGRVVVPRLHAVEVPAEPRASAGMDVGGSGQPLFLRRQARARHTQARDPPFRSFDVVGRRVFPGGGCQRFDVSFQRKQVCRFRGGFVAEVGFSRTGVGVARDAPAAFRRHAAPRRAVVSQGAAFHARLRARPGQRRGRRRSAAVVARVSLAGTRFGFFPAPRFRRHHVDAVVADGGVAACRIVVDVGLADFPAVGAGGELRPAGPRVVFVPALFARRLRVFLQIHLRHHVAAGVLYLQASPVVHPKEERAGAVEFFALRSFRDGECPVRTVPVRRRARRSHSDFSVFVDFFKWQRVGLRSCLHAPPAGAAAGSKVPFPVAGNGRTMDGGGTMRRIHQVFKSRG